MKENDDNTPSASDRFDHLLRRAISGSLKDARLGGKPRNEIAKAMGAWLGNPRFSVSVLDKFAAESNETHNINAKSIMAFVHATGSFDVLHVMAEEAGCILLKPEEAQLAELVRIRVQIDQLQQREHELLRSGMEKSAIDNNFNTRG